MVFINNNYHIKEYLKEKLAQGCGTNTNVDTFVKYLGLSTQNVSNDADFYECASNGFNGICNQEKLSRLFKCAAEIDGVPMPWHYDVIGLLGIKLAVAVSKSDILVGAFNSWIGNFLKPAVKKQKFNSAEETLAKFILNEDILNKDSSPVVLLLLYYKGLYELPSDLKDYCITEFWKIYTKVEDISSVWLMAALIYVFNNISEEQATVPANNWSLENLISFLEKIPAGLNCWTWEEKAKTKNSTAVKWQIENEYHVQNLLYVLLAPIFSRIQKEINLPQQGHKNPRADIYIPELHLIIEIKYRKDKAKKFVDLTEELAADKTLYTASEEYEKCKLVAFLWDNQASTEEHQKFKNGIYGLKFDGCVVVSSPSCMRSS